LRVFLLANQAAVKPAASRPRLPRTRFVPKIRLIEFNPAEFLPNFFQCLRKYLLTNIPGINRTPIYANDDSSEDRRNILAKVPYYFC
jgi:hypothetical protein